MGAKQYTELEKDKFFKRSYMKGTPWWKSMLVIPPICLLFTGLVGVVYLLKLQMLASWYVAPYVVIFVLGTILFKAIRMHLTKAAINKDRSYLVCLAQSVGAVDGHEYVLFATNNRRHDKNYIDNIARNVDAEALIKEYKSVAKRRSVKLVNEATETEYYIRAYFHGTLKKRNARWDAEKTFPVLFVDEKYTFIVKAKDLD